MREAKMPSGAVLKISLAPFAASKALYQALLAELRGIPMAAGMDRGNMFKDLFCTAFASPHIEAALAECFKRCTYNAGKGDLKIDDQTFEVAAAREDYTAVCIEVAKENVSPFAKSLYAEYARLLATVDAIPT